MLKRSVVYDSLNARRVKGRLVDGVVQCLFEEQLAAAPAAPRPLTESERWMFARNEHECQIRQGNVEVRTPEFGANYYLFGADWFAGLGDGYKLTVRFDPADPSQAAIFNRETSPARIKVRAFLKMHWPGNFAGKWHAGQRDSGLAPGEFIGLAPLLPASPYFARCKTREMRLAEEAAASAPPHLLPFAALPRCLRQHPACLPRTRRGTASLNFCTRMKMR